MRNLNYLIQLFPDKTGEELLEIQAQDKRDDELEYQKQNEDELKFIDDINTNGGYYRGSFGLDQYYYYRVYDVELRNPGITSATVEKVVIFYGNQLENGISIERKTKNFQDLSKYGLQSENRVTVKEWNEVNEYIENITKKFW